MQFSGRYYYIYDGQKLVSKKPLSMMGLPSYVDRIRLVYAWNYWSERPVYLWTETEYWRVDKVMNTVYASLNKVYMQKVYTTCAPKKRYVPSSAKSSVWSSRIELILSSLDGVYLTFTFNG